MQINIHSFSSLTGRKGEVDFYIRRHITHKSEMAFKSRTGKQTINCWGIRVKGGDPEQLRKLLNAKVDWVEFAVNGHGSVGALSKHDVLTIISRFVSPIINVIYKKNPYKDYGGLPRFYIKKKATITKPVVKAELDLYDRPKSFSTVYVYSGDVQKIIKTMESVDWSERKDICSKTINKEFWKRWKY